MTKRDTTPAERLLRLLEDERMVLLEGDLGALPAFIAAKERLLAEIEADPKSVDAALLTRLRTAATVNQALLDAAAKGVRAARERLELARSGGPALSTYDATGKPATRSVPHPKVERRA